jgi:hypothetical protein
MKPGLPAKQATCHPEERHCAKGLCKSCYNKAHYDVPYHKAEWRERYARNKEEIKARQRAYWHSKRKHLPGERRRARARARRQREENPEKMKAYCREWHLKKTYGITIDERDQMFAKHEGKCWLCKESTATMVDHDHATGEVRGTLCIQCNYGLGNFSDDTGKLLKAIEYLNRYTRKVVSNGQ